MLTGLTERDVDQNPGSTSPKSICFYGHFGTLNSGNEGTLLAVLWHLRDAYPGSRFCCVCTNPEAVVARDGIEAVRITERDARLWNRDLRLDKRLANTFLALGEE